MKLLAKTRLKRGEWICEESVMAILNLRKNLDAQRVLDALGGSLVGRTRMFVKRSATPWRSCKASTIACSLIRMSRAAPNTKRSGASCVAASPIPRNKSGLARRPGSLESGIL
jgi:hypothetical protein